VTIEIRSTPLYPREERAYARRRTTNWQNPVGDPWPAFGAGDEIIVHDTQGWTWKVKVVEADLTFENDPKATVEILEKEAQPMPPLRDGMLKLPNVSGHAHVRSWARGDIIELEGRFYKVASAKPTRSGSEILYKLQEATPEQFAKRPGRVRAESRDEALRAVGSAIQTQDGGWLHVKKVKTTSFRGPSVAARPIG